MAKTKKSPLMTPDPYHTPGYAGYVPQFKYQVGETFGSHTHKLLTDSPVPVSSNSVLSDTSPAGVQGRKEPLTGSAFYQRSRSLGDQKYAPHMVPGYSGYVPKRFQQFGGGYADSCHSALGHFNEDQQRHRHKMAEMKTLSLSQTQPQSKKMAAPCLTSTTHSHPATPLQPVISGVPKFYVPPYAQQHTSSPYNMPHGHPLKYCVSGYTGFVPRARNYLGQGYPTITRRALQDFANEEKRLRASWSSPVQIFRQEDKTRSPATIYVKDSALLPHYTGHIPGQQFKFGNTFGWSTAHSSLPTAVQC